MKKGLCVWAGEYTLLSVSRLVRNRLYLSTESTAFYVFAASYIYKLKYTVCYLLAGQFETTYSSALRVMLVSLLLA